MRLKILFSALLVVLFCIGMSATANAQHRRKWNSDDSRIYVQPQDNDHVVYDGDRVLYVRHYHEHGDSWCRRCYNDDYRDDYRSERRYYRHRDRGERDEYYSKHQKQYHYSADYTQDHERYAREEYYNEPPKKQHYSADYSRDR